MANNLEAIASEICNDYCKYPLLWDDNKMGTELSESEICRNCPLNRLLDRKENNDG